MTYWQDRELKKLYEAQKEDYPDPQQIEPYDPEEQDPDDGPQPDGHGPVYPTTHDGGEAGEQSDEDSQTQETADAEADDPIETNEATPESDGDAPATGDETAECPGDVEMMLRISGICDELRATLAGVRRPGNPSDPPPAIEEPVKDTPAKS